MNRRTGVGPVWYRELNHAIFHLGAHENPLMAVTAFKTKDLGAPSAREG